MRNTYLVKPSSLRVLNSDTTYEGVRSLRTDSVPPYGVTLVSTGTRLNEAETSLQLRYGTGKPGGEHDFMVRPNDLMPRRLQGGFRFLAAYDSSVGEPTTNAQARSWWGQSDKGIKDYYKLDIEGVAESTSRNWRLFSYRGDLYGVTDYGGQDAAGNYRIVTQILRFNETDNKFYVVKRFFEDPVDKPILGRGVTGGTRDVLSPNVQMGSPDVVVYNDEVLVFWRVSDTGEGLNRIVGYSASGDLSAWAKITDFVIEDSLGSDYAEAGNLAIPVAAQKNFRLRVAEGNGVIMIGYFGVVEYDGTHGQADAAEFRTFTSFDGGSTFISNQGQMTGVIALDPQTVVTGRGSQSLHPYFVAKLDRSSVDSTNLYSDMNTRFALYFDEDMGSFVIIKGGDPNPKNTGSNGPLIGGSFLMAIKTVDGSFSDWEPCLQLEMEGPITGLNLGSDPTSFTLEVFNEGLYIYDVDVVPDAGSHTILLAVRSRSILSGVADCGVAIGEFKFVDKRRMVPGSYRKLFAYGTQTHPEFAFVCSPFDVTTSGLVSPGHRQNVEPTLARPAFRYWVDLGACRWRNQIAVTARPLSEAYNTFFAVCAPWSNMGEHVGYQLSYCRWHEAPWNSWYFTKVSTGTGSVTWTGVTGWTSCYAADSSHTAYINGYDSGVLSNPPWVRDGEDDYPGLKCKFTFKWDKNAGHLDTDWVEMMRMGRNNEDFDRGHEIRVRILGGGDIEVREGDNTLIETLSVNLDLTKAWDVVFKIGPTPYNGNSRLTFWYRENGTQQWYTAGLQPLILSAPSVLPKLRVGYLGASVSLDTAINIGDVFCGSSTKAYGHVFTRNRNRTQSGTIEGMDRHQSVSKGYLNEPYTANAVQLYGNNVELMDGSVLQLTGAGGAKDYGVDYTYGKSLTRNSSENTINGLSGSVWDFSDVHDFLDNRTDVVYENLNQEKVDSLTLVNMVGVTSIIVAGGTWDEVTNDWVSTPVEYLYEVPYELLNVDSVDGNIIFLSDIDKYSTSELIGYSITVHDGADFTDSIVITDNYDGVVVCATAVPTDLNDEWRLMSPSATFDLDASIGDGSSHFGVTFEAAVNIDRLQIGEVVFGTALDVSDWVDSDGFKRELGSSFRGAVSSRGFMHLPMSQYGAVKESVNLNFGGLTRTSDASERVIRMFNELYEYEAPFPLVMEKETGEIVTRLATVDSQVSQNSGGFTKEISVKLDLQNWRVRTVSDFDAEAPVVTAWGVNDSNPTSGTSVDFYVTASDPQGETLTYDWEWGDQTANGTAASESHSYSSDGEYLATVTVTNTSGKSTTRSMNIFVHAYDVASYDLTVDDDTPALGAQIQLTLQALDENGVDITTDNSTTVMWFLQEGFRDPVTLEYDTATGLVTVTHPDHGIPNFSEVLIEAEDAAWEPGSLERVVTVVDSDSYTYSKANFPTQYSDPGQVYSHIINVNHGFDASNDGTYSPMNLGQTGNNLLVGEHVQQLSSGATVQRFISARTGTFHIYAIDSRGKSASQRITVS